MAIRNIRLMGDEMLTKSCREVTEITPRIRELIDDMIETMHQADGIGLAAPQVGVLRRIVVIDISDVVNAEDFDDEADETDESENAGDIDEAKNIGDACDAEDAGEDEDAEDYGEEMTGPLILINPVITHTEGEQTGDEGCLSLPGKVGRVTRPEKIEATYFDENMEEYELTAEGLLARAICHEVDHLNGHMYVELVEGEIRDIGYDEPDEEDDEEAEEKEEEAE